MALSVRVELTHLGLEHLVRSRRREHKLGAKGRIELPSFPYEGTVLPLNDPGMKLVLKLRIELRTGAYQTPVLPLELHQHGAGRRNQTDDIRFTRAAFYH